MDNTLAFVPSTPTSGNEEENEHSLPQNEVEVAEQFTCETDEVAEATATASASASASATENTANHTLNGRGLGDFVEEWEMELLTREAPRPIAQHAEEDDQYALANALGAATNTNVGDNHSDGHLQPDQEHQNRTPVRASNKSTKEEPDRAEQASNSTKKEPGPAGQAPEFDEEQTRQIMEFAQYVRALQETPTAERTGERTREAELFEATRMLFEQFQQGAVQPQPPTASPAMTIEEPEPEEGRTLRLRRGAYTSQEEAQAVTEEIVEAVDRVLHLARLPPPAPKTEDENENENEIESPPSPPHNVLIGLGAAVSELSADMFGVVMAAASWRSGTSE